MKVVIISDTHKKYEAYKKIVDKNLDADIFIHLGDGEHEFRDVANLYSDKQFVFVKGNCDFGAAPTARIVEVCGYKILCTHGHTFDVHSGLDKLIQTAKEHKCIIALYGHTHLYRTEYIDNIYVMNPGSIDSPRDRRPATYGVITLNRGGTVKMDIVAFKG